jgi:hypothetical protein
LLIIHVSYTCVIGIVMLVDEVDTEEMQDQAAKNVVGKCPVWSQRHVPSPF